MDGSLLRLFKSEYFNLDLKLQYLCQRSEPGVQDYILNLLFACNSSDLYPYLHQLITFTLHSCSRNSIRVLLLNKAFECHTFAMRLYFLLQSQISKPSGDLYETIDDLVQQLEMIIINGRKPGMHKSNDPPSHLFPLVGSDSECLDAQFSRKTIRHNYFENQVQFANGLGNLSILLFKRQESEREQVLQAAISGFNDWLSTVRDKNSMSTKHSACAKRLFRGINLPFMKQEQSKSNLQIVQITPDNVQIFKTRCRTPFRIVLECIDINEVVDFHDYSITIADAESTADASISIRRSNLFDFVEALSDIPDHFALQNSEEAKYSDLNDLANQEPDSPEPVTHTSPNPEIYKKLCEIWGEPWAVTVNKIRQSSQFGIYSTWTARPMIVKGNDDLRQEMLAMEVINKVKQVWDAADLKLFVQPYEILALNSNSGIVEYIPDTVSIHQIKKQNNYGLRAFYEATWGGNFEEAQKNFAESLAGYSLICYLLNIKDRHNGNMLINGQGHIIHIDFGFMLTNSPGGNINFESAPFKLTSEMIELLDGVDGEIFNYYRMLMVSGFLAIRKECDAVINLVEMISSADYPCLKYPQKAVEQMRARFWLTKSDSECIELIGSLVKIAGNNWRTNKYDYFQNYSNGICY